MFFPNPNVISVPSPDTLGFVLDVLDSMAGCWCCRIRDPLTGAVLRASGKKDSRNEDRDASLGVFHGFFYDFFPPKKGRLGFTLGARIREYPRLDTCVSTAKSEMVEDDAATYIKLVLEGVL